MGKDKGPEFVRIRSRKGGEKDRDSDTQSNAGSTITTLRDRKHRKSVTSKSSPGDSQSSTVCPGDQGDQLPMLSETDEGEFVSASTSPILRIRSNESNPKHASLPSVPKTPANLQPYLEDSDDAISTIVPPNRLAESKEWIGPQIDHESIFNESSNLTPTPGPQRNPLERPLQAGQVKEEERLNEKNISTLNVKLSADAKQSFLDSNQIYPWSSGNDQPEKLYYPSQMSNPFLPVTQPFPGPPVQQVATAGPSSKQGEPGPSVKPTPMPIQTLDPAVTASPAVTGPTSLAVQRQNTKPPSRPNPPRRESRGEYPPPAKIDQPSQLNHSPPMHDAQVHPNMMVPIPPALSPVPMHQTQSNPLPYPGVPARFDHPSNILLRVGNALPDIAALMDIYHGACSIVQAREQLIGDLEARKQLEADRQHKRIDALSQNIESMIRDRKLQEQKLQDEIEHLERKNSRLQESLTRESRHKEAVLAAKKKLEEVMHTTEKEHQEETQNMMRAFAQEKERMVAIHTGERQSLLDQLTQTARAAEDQRVRAERKHAGDIQAQETRWQRHLNELQGAHAKKRDELEATIQVGNDALSAERHKQGQMRDEWEKQQASMASQWDRDREALQKSAQDERQILSRSHAQEKEALELAVESARHKHNNVNAQLAKEQRDRRELQKVWDQAQAFHKAEVESASETFRREKAEYTKATEAAAAQQVAEFEAKMAKVSNREPQAKPRDPSESRKLREADDVITLLRQEKEDLMRSQGSQQSQQLSEAQDMISRLRKENETLKADKSRAPKTEATGSSRSSTPAPKEDRLERTKSNRMSGFFGTSTVVSKGRDEESHRSHRRDRTS